MKVDFVKEKFVDGEIVYYTSIDGVYVNNSISHDSEKAIAIYESIIAGNMESKTIIRTTIIENGN